METPRLRDTNVQFWGMPGQFSVRVLQGMLDAGTNVVAIVTPASGNVGGADPYVYLESQPHRSLLPLSNPYFHPNIIHIGWERNIPVVEVRNLASSKTMQILADHHADVAVVACFPWRIPPQILSLPTAGFLNLHTSLLPELRGPYPLFWTFRLGITAGLTVHYMDHELDTGDIVLQKEIGFPDGIFGYEADILMAQHGAAMLALTCRNLATGTLSRSPQSGKGSYYPRPGREDFRIPTTWPARRAFNFICGTAEWGHPFQIVGHDIDLIVRSAISFEPETIMQQTFLRNGSDYQIQFSPGLLHARR